MKNVLMNYMVKKYLGLVLWIIVKYISIFQKMEDSLLIGIVLGFGRKIPTSFGMSTMVKTMVGQLGMI